jgi:hypothetical protein
MSNGEVCCILGVCCPAGSAQQREALMHEIQKRHVGLSDEQAGKRADQILKKYDNFKMIKSLMDEEVAA